MLKLFKRKKKDPAELIRELFKDAEVPSFPGAIMEVLSVLRDPASSVNDLIEKVERDPGLSIKLLRTVNSAAFGLSTRVNHVGHAVSLLGRSRLETIVLSIAVKTSLPEEKGTAFDYKQFWYTAAKRACLARQLAKRLHPSTEFKSFTEGLLMDMGVLLLHMNKKKEYTEIYEQWQRSNSDLSDLEYEAFGFDHTEVGAIIAKEWQLPEHLIHAIQYHHASEDDMSQTIELPPAIQLTSFLKDSQTDDGHILLIKEGLNRFDLSDDELGEYMKYAFEAATSYQELL